MMSMILGMRRARRRRAEVSGEGMGNILGGKVWK